MPSPESLKLIREALQKAEDNIRKLESEILLMEKAGIDASLPRLDLKNLKDQAAKLKSVYG